MHRIWKDAESKISKKQISRWTKMSISTIKQLFTDFRQNHKIEQPKASREGEKNSNAKIPSGFHAGLEKSVLNYPMLVDHERAQQLFKIFRCHITSKMVSYWRSKLHLTRKLGKVSFIERDTLKHKT